MSVGLVLPAFIHQRGSTSVLSLTQMVEKVSLQAALDQCNSWNNAYARETFRSNEAGPLAPDLKAKPTMTVPNNTAGTAALAICESHLLALNDRKILLEKEILGILKDAAAAHEFAPDDGDAEMHVAVAALINSILAGGNSVRRR